MTGTTDGGADSDTSGSVLVTGLRQTLELLDDLAGSAADALTLTCREGHLEVCAHHATTALALVLPADGDLPGVQVPAAALRNAIAAAEDPVALTYASDRLTVGTGPSSSAMSATPAPAATGLVVAHLHTDALEDLLSTAVALPAAQDPVPDVLRAIGLHLDPDAGRLTAAATDRFTLATVTVPAQHDAPAERRDGRRGWMSDRGPWAPVPVPATALRLFAAAVRRCQLTGHLTLARDGAGEGWVQLSCGPVRVRAARPEGDLPAIGDVLPAEFDTTFTADPFAFVTAAKVAAVHGRVWVRARAGRVTVGESISGAGLPVPAELNGEPVSTVVDVATLARALQFTGGPAADPVTVGLTGTARPMLLIAGPRTFVLAPIPVHDR